MHACPPALSCKSCAQPPPRRAQRAPVHLVRAGRVAVATPWPSQLSEALEMLPGSSPASAGQLQLEWPANQMAICR